MLARNAALITALLIHGPSTPETITLEHTEDPWGPAFGPMGAVTFSFSNLPTVALSDAVMTLVIHGDLNGHSEAVDFFIDGVSYGRLLDNNPANDGFDFQDLGLPNNDFASQTYQPNIGTSVLHLTDLQDALSDGELIFTIDPTPQVENVNFAGLYPREEFIEFSIVFDAVPEPASIALLGLGGLLIVRRSRGTCTEQSGWKDQG